MIDDVAFLFDMKTLIEARPVVERLMVASQEPVARKQPVSSNTVNNQQVFEDEAIGLSQQTQSFKLTPDDTIQHPLQGASHTQAPTQNTNTHLRSGNADPAPQLQAKQNSQTQRQKPKSNAGPVWTLAVHDIDDTGAFVASFEDLPAETKDCLARSIDEHYKSKKSTDYTKFIQGVKNGGCMNQVLYRSAKSANLPIAEKR